MGNFNGVDYDYSNYNNYLVEKKSQYFKSAISKNPLVINKANNLNKLMKNNYNFGFDLSPLKGSLTIEKLNPPNINKASNRTVHGNNPINETNFERLSNNYNFNNTKGNVNPFTLNSSKENSIRNENNNNLQNQNRNSNNFQKSRISKNNQEFSNNKNNNYINSNRENINKKENDSANIKLVVVQNRSISNKDVINVSQNDYNQNR